MSTSLQCPLCQQADSALHILSGCRHTIILGMITERHNVACRLIMKAISKGSLAVYLVHLDASSTNCLAQQDLKIPEHANNRTVPSWLFDACSSARDRFTFSRPDAILVTPLPPKNHSSFAPGVTPKTSQRRWMQSSRAQCQHEGDTPRWG